MSEMLDGHASAADGDASGAGGAPDDSAADAKIPVVTALKDMLRERQVQRHAQLQGVPRRGRRRHRGRRERRPVRLRRLPEIIYREAADGGDPVKLVPNSMTQAMSGGASSAATAGTMMTGTEVFNEMIDDQELLDSQYDVVAGRWANAPDEAVLVLSSRGTVGDYTLYSIGALDINELNDLVSSAMSADGEVQTPETDADFTYSDALSCTFKVLSPSDAYRKNDETGGWTDMSDDAEFMASKVKDGLDLRIVGVVKPNGTGNSQALSRASPTLTA